MRFRRRRSPLLLLLLPSLAAIVVAASPSPSPSPSKLAEPRGANPSTLDIGAEIAGQKPSTKSGLGTKDAPVDGKDGKPHAGPFVETEKKKPSPEEDNELVTQKKIPLKNAPEDLTVVDGVKIPEVNDGVMNDPERPLPKEGSTGTEGGMTEKEKARKAQEGQTGEKVQKKPDSPKEAPPLPHSEEERIKGSKVSKVKETTTNSETETKKTKSKDGDSKSDDTYDPVGFEKPNDLPDTPHMASNPLPNSANKDHLDVIKDDSKSTVSKPKHDAAEEDEEGLIRPFHSYILSLTMIIFSEIGDKTFLIAAIMAMKHDRLLVFSAALSALITMTVLSAVLGHAVPTLLPKRFTNFLAALLFLVFGLKLLREGWAMSPSEGVAAEMQEVEMELEEKEHLARQMGRRRSSISPYSLEMGLGRNKRKSRSATRLPSPPRSPSLSPEGSPIAQESGLKGAISGLTNLLSLILSPSWVQTFVMTFLGEWGDRSQIATIAMAAGQDYWWVTGGAVCGHAICTGVAVIGGRAIAGRVSMRIVTLGGAVTFLIFGLIYFVEAMYYA